MFDARTGHKPSHKRVCHVAYTLNNEQPVISTIIGDQPLFYMDYDMEYEDEDYGLDLDFAGQIERELGTLKHELESLERFSSDFLQTTEDRIESFLDNADSIIGQAVQKASLGDAISILSESRLGGLYIDHARSCGINIIESDQTIDAEYNAAQKTILVGAALDQDEKILSLIHVLRACFLEAQDAYINPLRFGPDEAVFVNRLYAADRAASMVRIAWELQLAGHRSVWEKIENSSMSDLAHVFAREAYFDFRTLNNGMACAAVFEGWFLSERCRGSDKVIIQDMLADYQGHMFDVDDQNDKESLTPVFVARFGELPSGNNYLSGHVDTIMSDPVFTDVRDRANANFLWFIKFERSFREAEQDLQNSSVSSSGGVRRSDLSNDTDQDHDYASSSADIIALSDYARVREEPAAEFRSGRGASIIYLRRWSGD